MEKNNKILAFSVLLLSLISLSLCDDLRIKKVDRQIVLNAQYPLQQTFVEFRSQGNVNTFKHIVPIEIAQRISKIVFARNKQSRDSLSYTRQEYLYDGQKYALFKVELDRQYFSDQQGQIYIITVFLNRYVNFPQEITMTQDQKFQLSDAKNFVSPYHVVNQINTYKFDKLLNYDKDGQVKGINTVIYKQQNTEPFAIQRHTIHGVNNKPQVYFTNVQRILQVSHWGNIAITEFYSLKNFGPSLKGQFSRISFGSQEHIQTKNAFKGIEAQLPHEAWGLYYRDQVGNISTSKAYRDDYQNKVRLALVPRFALLGQWKCNWQVGYNLPTKKHLFNQGSKFQLDNIQLQYTLQKIISQNYNFKIILPQGSTNVKVKVGNKQIVPTRIQKSFGYLDFFGRPTYVFQNYRQNLKKKAIVVDYQLDTFSLLYKPFVLVIVIFSLLAILIVARRLKLEAFKEVSQKIQ